MVGCSDEIGKGVFFVFLVFVFVLVEFFVFFVVDMGDGIDKFMVDE